MTAHFPSHKETFCYLRRIHLTVPTLLILTTGDQLLIKTFQKMIEKIDFSTLQNEKMNDNMFVLATIVSTSKGRNSHTLSQALYQKLGNFGIT